MKLFFLITAAAPAFAFLGLGPYGNVPGEVVDVPAFKSVTDIVVISGATKYPQAQEKLLSELEGKWLNDACWHIMGHEEARTKFQHGPAPAPSIRKWGAGSALEGAVFKTIPERNSGTGVLIFWVTEWEGTRSRAITPIADAAETYVDKPRRKRQRYKTKFEPEVPPYSRVAAAQLFDSKTGKELWRAYKTMGRILNEQPSENREARKEQAQFEFQEFAEFFDSALASPENMEGSCASTGKTPAYLASSSKQKTPSIDETMKRLQSGDGEERAAAAKALGERGGDAAVDALIATLKDENPKVRGTAAKALGIIKDERAVPPLIALLNDGSKYVRALGAQALGVIGDGRANGPLKILENDKEELVRKEAGIALKKLWGDPSDLDMDLNMDVNMEGLNLGER
ncbi:MAG: hypothetical protein A2X29_09630 [Elusimicrobia bacterium GWA2_64_40]|nr:MAG: hypothetical protein A2X29_09630 [Elusimicrobia bacterium GWA2_64_40]OGR62578.1 MAG: hypothetical protein A2X30_08050 [Elusimicrobia bacterium GWB2_63_16]